MAGREPDVHPKAVEQRIISGILIERAQSAQRDQHGDPPILDLVEPYERRIGLTFSGIEHCHVRRIMRVVAVGLIECFPCKITASHCAIYTRESSVRARMARKNLHCAPRIPDRLIELSAARVNRSHIGEQPRIPLYPPGIRLLFDHLEIMLERFLLSS